jgi:hypothetical protein
MASLSGNRRSGASGKSADGDREIVLMSWGFVLLQKDRAPRRVTNQILNGASVISLSPFIGVELTSWKARTLPQVTAVSLTPKLSSAHRVNPQRKPMSA